MLWLALNGVSSHRNHDVNENLMSVPSAVCEIRLPSILLCSKFLRSSRSKDFVLVQLFKLLFVIDTYCVVLSFRQLMLSCSCLVLLLHYVLKRCRWLATCYHRVRDRLFCSFCQIPLFEQLLKSNIMQKDFNAIRRSKLELWISMNSAHDDTANIRLHSQREGVQRFWCHSQ